MYKTYKLYLIPFLHQTTTIISNNAFAECCILFHFYIKPQPLSWFKARLLSCILFHFYIKPQPKSYDKQRVFVVSYSISTSNHNNAGAKLKDLNVVSYSISTSNHNASGAIDLIGGLYLIPFLHQTTTDQHSVQNLCKLYLIPFLHQTTTSLRLTPLRLTLYLIPFLHQTTT